jgi:heat shock 70kDa protein 1/2/6/8
VIQHPDHADLPAYKVEVGADSPTERILTVAEVTTLFLKSLIGSAKAFLGKPVDGVVISVPAWFDEHQRLALQHAAEAVGVKVLQLLDEAGAAVVATSTGPLADGLTPDRTQLIVDVGASALELGLVSLRVGLAHSLATVSDHSVGGDQIDDAIIRFFAKEFTKKTKTPLTVCPAADKQDQRAEAKLRLAVEHTKRTISASPGAATCSVESLKDGIDYTGAINRMRFDMEVRTIYNHVLHKAQHLVKEAGLDPIQVDEIVYVGGSASLPGLDETLVAGFGEAVVTPFTAGTVVGGGVGDPTTILARGCALQAHLLAGLGEENEEIRWAFDKNSKWTEVKATTKTVGLLFPEESAADEALGGQWVVGLKSETSVPARRAIRFDVDLGESGAKKVGFELWEAKEAVKTEMVKPPKIEYDDGDEVPEDEEEEPEEEVKERIVNKENLLGSIAFDAQHATQIKGRWRTKLEVQFIASADGALEVDCWEVGESGKGEQRTIKLLAA